MITTPGHDGTGDGHDRCDEGMRTVGPKDVMVPDQTVLTVLTTTLTRGKRNPAAGTNEKVSVKVSLWYFRIHS